jgi:Zn-dependent protease
VFTFAVVILLLGLFNLLPIPPLDGSALLERALPARYLPTWYKLRPYGLLLLLVLIFWSGALEKVLDPVIDQLFNWVFR